MEDEMAQRTRDPMARDLRTPKYRMRVVTERAEKNERRIGRKAKHKGQSPEGD
jgi:hypothetical protein